MKIYFGHSRMTYNTQMELDAIWIIVCEYLDCQIVNPNIPEHQEACVKTMGDKPRPGKEIGYFLNLTEDCDIGCFHSYYLPLWSAGSATEVNFMLEAGKKVFQIDIIEKTLTPIIEPVESFTFQETLDKFV
jgi:hypothetical protein